MCKNSLNIFNETMTALFQCDFLTVAKNINSHPEILQYKSKLGHTLLSVAVDMVNSIPLSERTVCYLQRVIEILVNKNANPGREDINSVFYTKSSV